MYLRNVHVNTLGVFDGQLVGAAIPGPHERQPCVLPAEFKRKKGDGWQRRKSLARWVSDVLIVHTGIALIWSEASQVDAISVLDTIDSLPNGLGASPSELVAAYDRGETISIAVSRQKLDAALGPAEGFNG